MANELTFTAAAIGTITQAALVRDRGGDIIRYSCLSKSKNPFLSELQGWFPLRLSGCSFIYQIIILSDSRSIEIPPPPAGRKRNCR